MRKAFFLVGKALNPVGKAFLHVGKLVILAGKLALLVGAVFRRLENAVAGGNPAGTLIFDFP